MENHVRSFSSPLFGEPQTCWGVAPKKSEGQTQHVASRGEVWQVAGLLGALRGAVWLPAGGFSLKTRRCFRCSWLLFAR